MIAKTMTDKSGLFLALGDPGDPIRLCVLEKDGHGKTTREYARVFKDQLEAKTKISIKPEAPIAQWFRCSSTR